MTLLQPSDVPSRAGINNAITSEIALHASTSDPNSLHYDSGWVTLSLSAGMAISSEAPRVRRVGKRVEVVGRVQPPGGGSFAAGTYTACVLPVGFRTPILNLVFAGAFASSAIYGRLYTGSNGNVNFQCQQATANASLAMSFFID